ncbi:MAG: hypothetical protein E2O36_01175 [Proteobacteria bacterium]|nr:MAG: hypothetical protein E2O36_01175 [Pseudomonadota bacterium]
MIEVERKPGDNPMVFNVVVSDSAGSTKHRVTLGDATYQKLTAGKITPDECVEAAFKFLLERESKSDILPSFDVNVINMSFPGFEKEFSGYM